MTPRRVVGYIPVEVSLPGLLRETRIRCYTARHKPLYSTWLRKVLADAAAQHTPPKAVPIETLILCPV